MPVVNYEDNSESISLSTYEEELCVLEERMLKEPQVDCPVIHRFGPGIYIREVNIPADTIAIGHRQREKHLNVFLKGKITMLLEDGTTKILTAPMIFVGQPGRKCGYIHEEVIWLNVYSTEERNVEKLEARFLDKSMPDEEYIRKVDCTIDREDYAKVLKEFGFDEKTARSQSENKEDQIPFPEGGYKVSTGKSNIEGTGLFATATIEPGEEIAPARLEGKRTPAGVYTNHSAHPNAEMVKRGGDIYLVAKKTIKGCLGGYLGEEITTSYRQSLILGGLKCRQLR